MNRTVVHDTFVIDRRYPASPARVFTAFADPDTKKQWWGDADIEKNAPHVIDFRVGGRESMAGDVPGGGASFTYDAVYQDIVENSRIVYSYEMTMDGRRISVSVATLEFLADTTEPGSSSPNKAPISTAWTPVRSARKALENCLRPLPGSSRKEDS